MKGWFDELPGLPKFLVMIMAWIVWAVSFLVLPRKWFERIEKKVNSLLDAEYFHI